MADRSPDGPSRDGARWFKPPRFRTDDAEHRQATWLELFFDLVFVVMVAGFVSLLRDDLSLAGLGLFAAVFVPTWWLWMDFSYYGDQFDSDDVVCRLALLTVMLGALVAGRDSREAIEHGTLGPSIFAAMYLILAGLYLRAKAPNPELAPLVRRNTIAMLIAAGVFAASAFVDAPWRYALWLAAIAVPMINSPLTYLKYPDLPSQVSHMPERLGLFTIIALGESMVAISAALGETGLGVSVLAGSVAGFALAAALWWTFFVRDDPSALSVALEGGRRALLVSHMYGYAHLLVYAGIVVAAVGVEEALLGIGGEHGGGANEGTSHEAAAHGPFVGALIAGGTGTALLGMALVHRAAARGLPWPVLAVRLGVALVLLAAAFAHGGGWTEVAPGTVLHLVAGTAVVLAVFETWRLPHPNALPDEAADAGDGELADAERGD